MSEFEDKLNSILNDPQQMDKIAGLAKSLMGGEAENNQTNSGADGLSSAFASMLGSDSGMDFGRIAGILSSGMAQNDEKQALLSAMKPYLSEKRQAKMDKAIKIASIARIARLAMGEMGDKDV